MRIVEHAIKQKWKEKSKREKEREKHDTPPQTNSYQKLQVGKLNADYQRIPHRQMKERKKKPKIDK